MLPKERGREGRREGGGARDLASEPGAGREGGQERLRAGESERDRETETETETKKGRQIDKDNATNKRGKGR